MHLDKQQWAIEDPSRAGNIKKELLHAWEWGLKSIAKLLKSNIGIGLDKHNTLAGTLYYKLPARPFPEPAGKGVVKH